MSGSDLPELLTLEEVERRHVLRVLEACHGNRTDAAKILGLTWDEAQHHVDLARRRPARTSRRAW